MLSGSCVSAANSLTNVNLRVLGTIGADRATPFVGGDSDRGMHRAELITENLDVYHCGGEISRKIDWLSPLLSVPQVDLRAKKHYPSLSRASSTFSGTNCSETQLIFGGRKKFK